MGAQHAITIGTTTSVRVAMATNKKSDSEIRLSRDMWSYPDPTLKWDPQNPHPSSTPWSGGDNGCVKHHLAEIDIGCPKQHLAGGEIWVRQTTSSEGDNGCAKQQLAEGDKQTLRLIQDSILATLSVFSLLVSFNATSSAEMWPVANY